MSILDSENSPISFKLTNLESGIEVHLFYYIVTKNILISILFCVQKQIGI